MVQIPRPASSLNEMLTKGVVSSWYLAAMLTVWRKFVLVRIAKPKRPKVDTCILEPAR